MLSSRFLFFTASLSLFLFFFLSGGVLVAPEMTLVAIIPQEWLSGWFQEFSVFIADITRFSQAALIVLLTGLLAAIFSHGKSLTYFLLFALAASLAYLLVHVTKEIFDIARPTDAFLEVAGYRYPSGHAALSAVIGVSLLIAGLNKKLHPSLRGILIFFALIIPLIVGISRISLNVHTLYDVLAGWALGAAVTLVVVALWVRKEVQKRR